MSKRLHDNSDKVQATYEQEEKFTPDEVEPPPPKEFIVTACVQFRVQGHSIDGTYRQFKKYMADLFNDAYNQCSAGEKPLIVPSYYDGLSAFKNVDVTVPMGPHGD